MDGLDEPGWTGCLDDCSWRIVPVYCPDGLSRAQVAVRSILLRGFDQQVAEKLGDVMKDLGVKFVRPAVPSKIEKVNKHTRFL